MRKWVVNLQPVPFETLPIFILMGAFYLDPSLKQLLENQKPSGEAFQYLDFITHGNPREIRLLLEALAKGPSIADINGLKSAVEAWTSVRQKEIDLELNKFVLQYQGQRTLRLFHSFLTERFLIPTGTPPFEFVDRGLLYKLEDGTWRTTSRQAHVALHKYFFSDIVPTFYMDSSLKNNTALLGIYFEALMLLELKNGHVFENEYGAWRFSDVSSRQNLQFSTCQEQVLLAQGTSKWDAHKTCDFMPTIFIPEISNFPFFDAVYHEPPSIGENGAWLNPHRLIFMVWQFVWRG